MAGTRSTYAAAQLRAGAKTSAAPTSTNPQQRAIQITFDPVVTPDSESGPPPNDPGYDVDAFQLSVGYDSNLMTIGSVDMVSPFGTPSISAGISAAVVPGGTLSVSGDTGNDPTAAGPGDVNIFSVTFILNSDVSFDQALNFSIFGSNGTPSELVGASPSQNTGSDFIEGYDPLTGQYLDTFGSDITPTFITTTFNQATQATGGGSSAPLPAGAWAGMLALGCCGWMARRNLKTALPARV
jgi:hypothetical protein